MRSRKSGQSLARSFAFSLPSLFLAVVWLVSVPGVRLATQAGNGGPEGSNYLPVVLQYWPPPTPTLQPGRLLISEVIYNPSGTEPDGEWIEIYNLGSSPVELASYKIGDEETPGQLEGMLQFPPGARIDPGQVVLVAYRAAAFKAQYGLLPDYEMRESHPGVPDMLKYTAWTGGNVELVNTGDEVLLLDASDELVDGISWGNSTAVLDPPAPKVADGHSLERSPVYADTHSASDWKDQASPGPGRVDMSRPTPSAQPTEPPTLTPTPSPTLTLTKTPYLEPSLTPTFTPSPTASLTPTKTTKPPAGGSPLVSEVFYDTPGTDGDEEWIELFNPTASKIDLSAFKIGDEETKGSGEGMFRFPQGAEIPAGGKIVVALKASGFAALYGMKPDFEIASNDPDVPDMIKYTAWSSGSLSLNNNGDEVLILNGSDAVVDAVVFEGGAFPGVAPHPGVISGHSIERSPASQDTGDCSKDFVDRDPPTPGS